MAFSFSSTGGSSGVTSITVSATSRQELNDIVQNFTLSNRTKSLLMPIAQRGYQPVEKYIILTPSTISWDSSGGTASLTIQSNDDWTIVSNGWIQLSRYEDDHKGPDERPNTMSGNGNTIIGLRCSENTGDTRNGGITGYCQSDSTISATTTVSQAGSYVKPYITLDKYIVNIPSSGMSGVTIDVDSNINWVASTDSRWIDIQTITGSSNGTIVFDVLHTDQSVDRRGSIYVSGTTDDVSAECVVEQSAATAETPYIIIIPTEQTVKTSGGTFVVTVSSNTNWDVSIVASGSAGDSRAWITTDVLNGYGDDEVRVDVAPMTEEVVERTGYISFRNDAENLRADCNITQDDADNTKIFYTSVDGNIITGFSSNKFSYGANLTSNTYENGVGVLTFDNNVTGISSNNTGNLLYALETITLPKTLQSIGGSVFYGATGLTSINIPNSVTSIGSDAFTFCSSLTAITIGTGVTELPYRCFTSVPNVDGSNLNLGVVEKLWAQCFYGCICGNLVIPDTVTNLGLSAFWESPITAVTVPSSVTTYNSATGSTSGYAFNGCSELVTADYSASIIPQYCFSNCTALTTVNLRENVSRIDNYAFRKCTSLVEIYSYNTTSPVLGTNVFSAVTTNGTLHYPNGSDYSSMIAKLPSGWTAVGDIEYLNISTTGFTVDGDEETTGNSITITPISADISYNISKNVDWITLSDTRGTGIKTITFDTSSATTTAVTTGVITISNSAATKTVTVTRTGCHPKVPYIIYYTTTGGTAELPYASTGWGANIVSNIYYYGQGILEFDGSVTSFPIDAYYSKKWLETIIIPNEVTVLNKESFLYCSKLKDVTIGRSVETVGNNVFYECTSLANIYAYPTTAPTLGSGVFTGAARGGTLHYPSGSDYSSWISVLPNGWTAVADL